jgi:hypothetical protein
VLIALKRMKYNHTGGSTADTVIPVLKKYELGERVGVFVADCHDLARYDKRISYWFRIVLHKVAQL